jgi:hypothetical protein
MIDKPWDHTDSRKAYDWLKLSKQLTSFAVLSDNEEEYSQQTASREEIPRLRKKVSVLEVVKTCLSPDAELLALKSRCSAIFSP